MFVFGHHWNTHTNHVDILVGFHLVSNTFFFINWYFWNLKKKIHLIDKPNIKQDHIKKTKTMYWNNKTKTLNRSKSVESVDIETDIISNFNIEDI